MATSRHHLNILLLVLYMFLIVLTASAADLASDTISRGRNITDGETLVSAGGFFTLGFFSPGDSTKRYLGIWFTVSKDAVYWVANRDRPLADTSGMLVVTDAGNLLLLDGSGHAVWSSNTTAAATAPTAARLLESGNLVVSDPASDAILWQSFDHPSNTLLPGMKVGRNLWTGTWWNVSSWRSASDPSPGSYRSTIGRTAVPEVVTWDGGAESYRTGPWNGLWLSGIPEMKTYTNLFTYELTDSPGEVTYGYVSKAGAPFSRLLLTVDGVLQRMVWDASTGAWKNFFQGPRDVCDAYGDCGAFGVCDAGAASTWFCGCVAGFVPASPAQWMMRDASGGCRRDVNLDCAGNGTTTTTTDGFLTLQGVKLPDTRNASVDADATLDGCRARCLANCSCVAYAPLDIRGGAAGSGCIMWTDALVDLRYVDGGQDLYLRAAKSELGKRSSSTALTLGLSVAAVVVIVLIVLFVLCVTRRRRRAISLGMHVAVPAANSIQAISHASTVPSVELSSVKQATRNFSESNIIGRGGFSVVYEVRVICQKSPFTVLEEITGGNLPDGRKLAVKRLIHPFLADQSGEAFMRELEVMSKLRHGNLVRLLSYCKEMNERILIYEFMRNKSLNLYIFAENPKLRALLDWEQRLEIIRGIAKGVAYLHEEEVIHRDLKPCNILLDDNWRPKIADFGTAKLFFDDQTDPTLVHSAGYTAPEYASQRYLTLKCDVYSFGVVVLEIVSGQRNRITPTLLSDVWESWNQCKIKDLLDSAVAQPETDELLFELERCIQIGLLCVQQSPDDRPSMLAVVAMLNCSSSQISLRMKSPARVASRSVSF